MTRPIAPVGFTETLVDAFGRACAECEQGLYPTNEEIDKRTKARDDLIQALTVPQVDEDFASVRDQFAMAAPVSIEFVAKHLSETGSVWNLANDAQRSMMFDVMARYRFDYADAMMAARKAGTK